MVFLDLEFHLIVVVVEEGRSGSIRRAMNVIRGAGATAQA